MSMIRKFIIMSLPIQISNFIMKTEMIISVSAYYIMGNEVNGKLIMQFKILLRKMNMTNLMKIRR